MTPFPLTNLIKIIMAALQDHDERVLAIKKVTKQLPPNNYHLLKRVIEHFVV